MKTKLFIIGMLLGTAMNMQAQGTLSFGEYDDIEAYAYEYYNFNCYDGSSWEVSPINFYYTNSGTQVIYTKEQVADMAGKNITKLGLKYYDEGAYSEPTVHVKVYLTETNRSDFYKPSNRYRYFDVRRTEPVFEDDVNFYASSDCEEEEIVLDFTTPFYYSGENNLVLTVVADDNDSATDGAFYINFFYADDMEDQALTFASEKKTFSEVLANEDGEDLYAERYSVSTIYAPALQFTYESATAPEAKWFSYVPAQDEDLDINGFEAYAVTSVDEYATLERVTTAKAGEALIVKQSVTPSISPVSGATKKADNLLQVSDGTVTGGEGIYALTKRDGKVGFAPVAASVTIPAGKVYLETNISAKFIPVDGTTGIESEKLKVNSEKSATLYNLQGQRVDANYKGVVIVNGKKVVKN